VEEMELPMLLIKQYHLIPLYGNFPNVWTFW